MTATEQVNAVGARLSIERRPSESILGRAYLLFEHEGLLSLIWSAGTPPLLSDFLEEARKGTTYTACYVEYPGQPPALAGLAWAFDVAPLGKTGRVRATIGVAFLREFQVRNIPRELATLALDDIFEHCGLEVAYGFVPIPNAPALRFLTKMGFKKVGVAPLFGHWQGEPCDLVLSCMTRTEWNSPPSGMSPSLAT